MPWRIERKHDHVAVVTMNTNKVNAQNPAFFGDLHAAFDRLEAEFSNCAVVLTGTVFSAGLDFDHHFPLFARRSLKEIDEWFDAYRYRVPVVVIDGSVTLELRFTLEQLKKALHQ